MAEILSTFGDKSITEGQLKEWFEEFRKKYAQIAGAPPAPQAQAQNELMRALLDADPNKTIPQLAQEFGASVDTILSHLRMSGILKNVKRTALTEKQRRMRLEVCSNLILRQSRDPSFLDRIVTYGEVWMSNGYTSDRKESLMIAVWWTTYGIIHHVLVPAGGRMTAQLYFYQLNEMHKKLLRMKGDVIEKRGMLMLHDTQLPYLSLCTIRALHQLGYEVLPSPEKSSDLLPTDYHFVPQFRQFMAGRVCNNDAELAQCVDIFLNTKNVQFFVSGIYDLVARWKKCFAASGDYFKT
ncbi:unnamed protein product [Strongylus vulgaris]|uniref:Mos1 transposase HTH domain-containing protein n=1 Tax=Strongylus vulgaris TaxID=40348 RepID=A0A3P7IDU3_STRVU|nr:unnamed protein product [Strongylus vulgaris]